MKIPKMKGLLLRFTNGEVRRGDESPLRSRHNGSGFTPDSEAKLQGAKRSTGFSWFVELEPRLGRLP